MYQNNRNRLNKKAQNHESQRIEQQRSPKSFQKSGFRPRANPQPQTTSWGPVSNWYNSYFEDENSFHKQVIFPGLKRIIGNQPHARLLDLACGQGAFSKEICTFVSEVVGADISSELIDIAKKSNKAANINYIVSKSDALDGIQDESIDIAVCILAMQNISDMNSTVKEVSRVLKKGGIFTIVLNHPMFRIPKASKWDVDYKALTWWRAVNSYMTEHKIPIDMTPGKSTKTHTLSFHRPLQNYVKVMTKHGLYLSRLEEWISHKLAQKGPHFNLSDEMRKEIPLFMCIEFRKF